MELELPLDQKGKPSLELYFEQISYICMLNSKSLIGLYLKSSDFNINRKIKTPDQKESDEAGKWYDEVGRNLLNESSRCHEKDEYEIDFPPKRRQTTLKELLVKFEILPDSTHPVMLRKWKAEMNYFGEF